MAEYRRAAHTMYALHYHFVFITKYRKPVLRGDIGREVRDLIREICRTQDIEVLQGHVRPDHVHLLLSAPPHLSPSRVMQGSSGRHPIISSRIIGGCGRSSGAGTCGDVATSCAPAGTSRKKSLRNIFSSKVPSPRTTAAFELASSEPE